MPQPTHVAQFPPHEPVARADVLPRRRHAQPRPHHARRNRGHARTARRHGPRHRPHRVTRRHHAPPQPTHLPAHRAYGARGVRHAYHSRTHEARDGAHCRRSPAHSLHAYRTARLHDAVMHRLDMCGSGSLIICRSTRWPDWPRSPGIRRKCRSRPPLSMRSWKWRDSRDSVRSALPAVCAAALQLKWVNSKVPARMARSEELASPLRAHDVRCTSARAPDPRQSFAAL